MTASTFTDTIRAQTQDAHERAESVDFIQALMGGGLNTRSLVRLLESLAPVYAHLEETLPTITDEQVAAFFDPRLNRAERLRHDLHVSGQPVQSQPSAAVEAYLEAITAASAHPERILAHHYTRYMGDLAGGQAIAKLAQRHYHVPPEALTYYDFSDLGSARDYRLAYRARLDNLDWTPTQQAEFIAECQFAFTLNEGLFTDLSERVGLRQSAQPCEKSFFASERDHLMQHR